MDGGYPQTLIEDLLSEIKFTKTSLKQNLQGGKRFIAVCDTIPTLSVYYKGSLNNKNGILYKANHNYKKFLKENH